MTLGRISGLGRLLECPGFPIVPTAAERAFKRDFAAAWGTLVHFVKENKTYSPTQLPSCPKLFEIEEEQALFEEDWNTLKNRLMEWATSLQEAYNGWEQEVYVGYDPLKHITIRDPEILHGLLTGHLDGLLLDHENKTAYIDDLKTGAPIELDDPQLLGYSLAVSAMVPGYKIIVSMTHYPRELLEQDKYIQEYGVPFTRIQREVQQDELESFRLWVLDALRSTQLRTGNHCVFCPAFQNCPEWAARTE